MTYDFSLQGITFIVAGGVAGLSLAAIANPARTGQALASFPRSRTMATVLTAVSLPSPSSMYSSQPCSPYLGQKLTDPVPRATDDGPPPSDEDRSLQQCRM